MKPDLFEFLGQNSFESEFDMNRSSFGSGHDESAGRHASSGGNEYWI